MECGSEQQNLQEAEDLISSPCASMFFTDGIIFYLQLALDKRNQQHLGPCDLTYSKAGFTH